jgi:hypothetical protein
MDGVLYVGSGALFDQSCHSTLTLFTPPPSLTYNAHTHTHTRAHTRTHKDVLQLPHAPRIGSGGGPPPAAREARRSPPQGKWV